MLLKCSPRAQAAWALCPPRHFSECSTTGHHHRPQTNSLAPAQHETLQGGGHCRDMTQKSDSFGDGTMSHRSDTDACDTQSSLLHMLTSALICSICDSRPASTGLWSRCGHGQPGQDSCPPQHHHRQSTHTRCSWQHKPCPRSQDTSTPHAMPCHHAHPGHHAYLPTMILCCSPQLRNS